VSKLFTSAAPQALHDDITLGLETPMLGLLGVNTPLPSHVSVDARMAPITSRLAATRRTGMHRDILGRRPDGTTWDTSMRDIALLAGRSGPPSQDDVVRCPHGMPLVTDPGNMVVDGYSNVAFFVLGAVIECAEGQPINAYIRQRLLANLGVSDPVIARTASGQRLSGEVPEYDSTNAGPSMLDISGVWAPGAYGGSFVMEPAAAAGAFAISVTTVAHFIGFHTVWDLGPRTIVTRCGDFDGTATIAQSRDNGLDLAVAFNFCMADAAKDRLLARIGPGLHAAGLAQATRVGTPRNGWRFAQLRRRCIVSR